MSELNDPVDDALRVLRDHEWTAPGHRAHLKETLMREFANHRMSVRRRRTLIAVGVGALALGSLGFVAAERFGWVTAILRAEVNGEIVDRELTPDEFGLVGVTLNTPDGPTDFLIQLPEGDGQAPIVIDSRSEFEFVPAEPEQHLPR